MAFNNETRGKLQRFVTNIRALLTDDFTRQLQQTYGMDPANGEVASIESLRHLDDECLETAQILRDIMEHYLASEGTNEKQTRVSVLQRIAREQAFTILNRLAALRMMEARGILLEAIGQGTQSQAFRLYQQVANGSLGDTGITYKYFLYSLFDLFSPDLPSLFDCYSPQSRLFPREVTLTKALDLINGNEIEPLWAEDETIGWIYQYFNSKEERKAMRDASQAPRNSRELAVRNQFFTPRYVVEFLVDNTLGRLWFNWTGGQTGLRNRCQYLLVKSDEQQPEQANRLRDPRTIKLLDPACGSMHFGLYAFDLFLEIYREAWAWEQTHGPCCLDSETGGNANLKPLSQTYTDQNAFLHDVPWLIIEHNIYGVDIDPRAAQIASLALWLRAQRAWHEAGAKAKDRPQVGRGHVVAAVAPPAEVDLRKRFIKDLNPLDAELFEKTLILLKGLPELGVLLQVEKELPALVRAVFGEHGDLFRKEDMVKWQKAEARLQEALSEFARAARSTYQVQLFAEDAIQGLRIIDHCREIFDVVVMNPPFGRRSNAMVDYYDTKYRTFKSDIGLAFVARCSDLIRKNGLLGALTSRTFLSGGSFDKWREEFLLGSHPIQALLDLGIGVLDDAMVETCAYTITGQAATGQAASDAHFVRALEARDKQHEINAFFNDPSSSNSIRDYTGALDTYRKFPNCILAYWISGEAVESIRCVGTLETARAATKHGVQTTDDFQFVRLAWEVRFGGRAANRRWPTLAKGGEYAPYYDNLDLCVDWKKDGDRLKSYLAAKRLATQGSADWTPWMNSPEFYFRPGLTFPARTASDFSPRILPADCVFTASGQALIFKSDSQAFAYLAGAFTRTFKIIVDAFVGSGDNSVSGAAANTYRTNLVNALPLPCDLQDSQMTDLGCEAVEIAARLEAKIETSPHFRVFPRKAASLKAFYAELAFYRLENSIRLLDINAIADRVSADLFSFDNDVLTEFFGPLPNEYPKDSSLVDQTTLKMKCDELIHRGVALYGPRRQLTKKTHVSNRRLELLSHINAVHPRTIVDALKCHPDLPSFEGSYAAKEASILFGLAMGRWKISTTSDEGSKNVGFSPLPENPYGMDDHGISTKSLIGSIEGARGILVDDSSNTHDIVHVIRELIEEVWPNAVETIEADLTQNLSVPSLRDYYSRNSRFFADHLSVYSGSRRKAPIYWPISTRSGSYTLWLYYPSLTDQTLFTAVNDFIEPKLKLVGEDVIALRNKGSTRSAVDEKIFEKLQSLEAELIELRESLFEIAPTYSPNHDDGVQITAAPLWRLFRHRPWQNALKATWGKLEKGDYDWAHLAMSYWPDRVREKCKTDKSLAIAHDLEVLYEEPANGDAA